MVRPMVVLTLGLAGVWAAAAYPAWKFGGQTALLQSAVAAGLCWIPAMATLAYAARVFQRPAAIEQQMLATLGGTGVRMAVVLGVAWLLSTQVPELKGVGFWLWLALFYLVSLGLEVYLVLLNAKASEAQRTE